MSIYVIKYTGQMKSERIRTMRNPILLLVALLLAVLLCVTCVLFCCDGDGTDKDNGSNNSTENNGNEGGSENGSASDGNGIFDNSPGEDLFYGDNIDPDGWTRID